MSIFSLNHYRDLFDKCISEFRMLENCRVHPDYDHLLFNVVLSVNHLFEWFVKDKKVSEPIKLECIKLFNPYSSPYDVSGDFKYLYRKLTDFPKLNNEQSVIRQLCNKAKHFKKTEIEKQERNDISVAGVMRCGDPLGAFHYIYTVENDGKDELLTELLKSNLDQWDRFLKKNV